MTIQYGSLHKKKYSSGVFARIEDTTHETQEQAVRAALWLTKNNDGETVISIFSVDMDTGAMTQIMDAKAFEKVFDSIDKEDWDFYMWTKEIPVPQTVDTHVETFSEEVLIAAE